MPKYRADRVVTVSYNEVIEVEADTGEMAFVEAHDTKDVPTPGNVAHEISVRVLTLVDPHGRIIHQENP